MSNYTPQFVSDLIANFDNKVKTFYTNFNGLKSTKIHAKLVDRRNELLNRGEELNRKIASIKQTYSTVKQWLQSLSGSFGLGFVPLAPAVIIAGLAAISVLGVAITVYLTDTARFAADNELLLKGVQLPNRDNTFSSSVGKLADLLAVGGALFVIYKIMSKGR
jgi:hypothetical protein